MASVTLKSNQKVNLIARGNDSDADSVPNPLPGVPSWSTVSGSECVALAPSTDGLTCVCSGTGVVGVAIVRCAVSGLNPVDSTLTFTPAVDFATALVIVVGMISSI